MSLLKNIVHSAGSAISSAAKTVVGAVSTAAKTVASVIVSPFISSGTVRPASTTTATTPKLTFSSPANDVEIVNAIADVLQKQKSTIEDWYIDECKWVAQFLTVPVITPATMISALPPAGQTPSASTSSQVRAIVGMFGRITSVITPTSNPTNNDNSVACAQAIANVKALIENICTFATKAKNSGFSPPDNPFAIIAQMNADRGDSFDPINVSTNYASDLVFNIKAYVDLLEAERQGGINFASKDPINQAQLAHISLSFNGLGGSGNVAADIMAFMPDSDQVKQNIAAQELAVLDFTKRVPYILFTLGYNNGSKKGILLGWKKIPDATGFLINRHATFSIASNQINITNDDIKKTTDSYLDYAKTHALSYLEDIDEKSVQLYFDEDMVDDELYTYTLQAYQKQSKAGTLFSIKTKEVQSSLPLEGNILDVLIKMDPGVRQIIGWNKPQNGQEATPRYQINPSTISPWPAYAQCILGNSSYDWLLAAVNIRASVSRKDARTTTRQYSYLNASSDFLKMQMGAGNFVQPENGVAELISKVEDSISTYGIVQTMLEIFQETGISYYFDGRDPADTSPFDKAGTDSLKTSSIFSIIGSAIDPETATVDIRVVANNMAQLSSAQGGTLSAGTVLGQGQKTSVNPSELSVPEQSNATDSLSSEDSLQFISKLGKMDDSIVDLTTFEGISRLMRVIRIFSDFGPDKIKSTVVDVPQPQAPKVSNDQTDTGPSHLEPTSRDEGPVSNPPNISTRNNSRNTQTP